MAVKKPSIGDSSTVSPGPSLPPAPRARTSGDAPPFPPSDGSRGRTGHVRPAAALYSRPVRLRVRSAEFSEPHACTARINHEGRAAGRCSVCGARAYVDTTGFMPIVDGEVIDEDCVGGWAPPESRDS